MVGYYLKQRLYGHMVKYYFASKLFFLPQIMICLSLRMKKVATLFVYMRHLH